VLRHLPVTAIGFRRRLSFEARLSWRFISGDMTSTLIPPMLFTCAAWRGLGLDWAALARAEVSAFVYFWLALYLFCLSNQATGVEEDRCNKPGRPLVVGVVTVRGALGREVITGMLFMGSGVVLGVAGWAAVWVALTALYNHLGWSRRWYGKNLCIVAATVAQLAAAWHIANPVDAVDWRLIAAVAVLYNLVMSVQDLRDVDGDRRAGRRTLPMVIGEWPTRCYAAVGLFAIPVAAHWWILTSPAASPTLWFAEALAAVVAWATAYRVLRYRTPASDHRTYLLYTGWYCLLLATVVLANGSQLAA
jgi:4-hydroxybenzoate polyprenyltransferase